MVCKSLLRKAPILLPFLLCVVLSACTSHSELLGTEATRDGKDTNQGPGSAAGEASLKEQDAFMVRQAEAMKKQQQELDDLKRQRYHDGYLRERYDVDGDGTID